MSWQLESVKSPIGNILLIHDGEALAALDFADHEDRMRRLASRYLDDLEMVHTKKSSLFAKVLHEYFDGDIYAIDVVKTHDLGTVFQAKCWAALRKIPAGQTRSYAQQARMIGKPKAMRAVGLANGANPISIVVPCHRVVGADGSLTGYGGGLPRKEWLLTHEARWASRNFTLDTD